MLLSIAPKGKTGKLLACNITCAEELLQEFNIQYPVKELKALRKRLDSETQVVEEIVDHAYEGHPTLVDYDEVGTYIRVYVFAKPPVPRLVLGIEGGIVQWTLTDSPVEVLRLDLDTEGASKNELIRWTDIDGGKGKAYACLDTTGDGVDLNPEYVEKVYNEVKPQVEKLHRVG